MADLLGWDFRLAEPHNLYACHDFLLKHKADLFSHLVTRWRDLVNVEFDALLYNLTSTYFEINAAPRVSPAWLAPTKRWADVPEGDKRRHGYSRDKRPDCPQVVIALVVTPDGLPLGLRDAAGRYRGLQDVADVPPRCCPPRSGPRSAPPICPSCANSPTAFSPGR
jgi:hypothetical protein